MLNKEEEINSDSEEIPKLKGKHDSKVMSSSKKAKMKELVER